MHLSDSTCALLSPPSPSSGTSLKLSSSPLNHATICELFLQVVIFVLKLNIAIISFIATIYSEIILVPLGPATTQQQQFQANLPTSDKSISFRPRLLDLTIFLLARSLFIYLLSDMSLHNVAQLADATWILDLNTISGFVLIPGSAYMVCFSLTVEEAWGKPLYKALLATVRSRGLIALATAYFATANNLPGGRTTHSRFKMPLQLENNSMRNIKMQSGVAELLRCARLLIWKETSMTKRQATEALDRTMQDMTDCTIQLPNYGVQGRFSTITTCCKARHSSIDS